MIMLPGLALFYGGLVRRKNVLSTIMHSFFGLALGQRRLGPDRLLARVRARRQHPRHPRLIGGLDFAGFMNVGLTRRRSTARRSRSSLRRLPADVCCDHAGLITGAFAERKRFASFVIFTISGRVRLLADRPLGLGRPTAGSTSWAARLRWRHRRPRLDRVSR
jgi:Amt family ammonium transporter